MSITVASRRTGASHQPHPLLPHAVSPPSPHTTDPQPTSPLRRPSKPVEEQKQAEPQLGSRMSSSSALEYSSSSLSSTAQKHYQLHLGDSSHQPVVSFAEQPAVPVVHASHHSSHHSATHLAPDAFPLPTASTASHSSSTSYLPATHRPHPHSDTEEEGDEEGEEEEGVEGEEGEYEEEEDSVDDSPRDGRILTFADEHGVQLCAFHVYDPTAVQNVTPRAEKHAGAGGGSSGGSERRKESAKVAAVERKNAEANCQCCIS